MKIGRPEKDHLKEMIDEMVGPLLEGLKKAQEEADSEPKPLFKLKETRGKETTWFVLEDFGGLVKYKAEVVRGSCLLCKHCTDMFWDYTNGPYAIICEHEVPEEEIMEKGVWGECEKFEGED